MSKAAGAAPSSARQPLVVGVFEDEVRAEQAVRALEVWRKANRNVGVGPIAVVARHASGTTTWRARGVSRPGRSALIGLAVGLVLFALPSAGAAALAAWVAGTVAFGLAGLVGAVPADHGGLVVSVALGGATLVGLLIGLVGAVIGCLVGLVVGLIDRQIRGLTRSEVAVTATSLGPGAWAAVARVQPAAEPPVREELVRLGGAPAVLEGAGAPAAPAAAPAALSAPAAAPPAAAAAPPDPAAGAPAPAAPAAPPQAERPAAAGSRRP